MSGKLDDVAIMCRKRNRTIFIEGVYRETTIK